MLYLSLRAYPDYPLASVGCEGRVLRYASSPYSSANTPPRRALLPALSLDLGPTQAIRTGSKPDEEIAVSLIRSFLEIPRPCKHASYESVFFGGGCQLSSGVRNT